MTYVSAYGTVTLHSADVFEHSLFTLPNLAHTHVHLSWSQNWFVKQPSFSSGLLSCSPSLLALLPNEDQRWE